MSLSLPVIVTTFGLLFVSELPDKTSIATLILSTKYKVWDVIVGAWLAFLIQTIVGVVAGSFLTLLPTEPIQIASGVGFLVFSYLSIHQKPDGDKDRQEEEKASKTLARKHRSAWTISFLVIFAAEWGDLTQMATAALVGQSGQPLSVGIGAVLALWSVTVIVALSGAKLGQFVNPRVLNIGSGILFGAIGVSTIAFALR